MKRLTTLLIVLLLAFTSSYAQKVINVGDADYIYNPPPSYQRYDLIFLKQIKNNLYRQAKLKINSGNPSIERNNIAQKDIDPNYLIPLKDLKSYTPKQWKDLLEEKTFFISKDSSCLETITTHGPAIISINRYHASKDSTNNKKNLNKYNFAYFSQYNFMLNYVYIRLQNDKYIVAMTLPNNRSKFLEDVLLPYSDRIGFITKERSMDYNSGYEAVRSLSSFDIELLDWDKYLKVAPTIDGKQQVVDFMNNPQNIVADSIKIMHEHIVTYTPATKLYDIYSIFGKKLPFENIRYLRHIFREDKQILIGNEMKYLVNNKLTDKDPKSLLQYHYADITFHTDSIKKLGDGIFRLTKGDEPINIPNNDEEENWDSWDYEDSTYDPLEVNVFEVISSEEEVEVAEIVYPKIEYQSYQLQNARGIENIFFEGEKQDIMYDASHDMSWSNNAILFLKKKNGKYNIATYQLDKNNQTFTITEQLPHDCDSLQMRSPTIFYSKGLAGVYPTMTTAKYKSAEVKDNVIRYQDTQGKTGWIEMDTKEIYPDL